MSKNIKQLRKRLIGGMFEFETNKLITPKEVMTNMAALAPLMAISLMKHNYDVKKQQREQQGNGKKKTRRKK